MEKHLEQCLDVLLENLFASLLGEELIEKFKEQLLLLLIGY